MRNRAAGLLVKGGKILLIHRIRDNSEYFVVPGGGIEENESIIDAVKREMLEEIGIKVEVVTKEPLYTFESDDSVQYYFLVSHKSGVLNTGTGPEFTDEKYSTNGTYVPKIVDIKDIVNGSINLVPLELREKFIVDICKLLNFSNISYKELL